MPERRESAAMVLLQTRFEPRPPAAAPALVGPASLLVMAAALALIALGSLGELAGGRLALLGQGLASAGVHAGFVSLGWLIARQGGPGWQRPSLRFTLALVIASVASRVHAPAALLYLLPLGVLLRDAYRCRTLRAIGVNLPADLRPIGLGIATGGFLGIHLLISASMTFGYGVRIESLAGYLGAIAYDVGANAVSAEWLFRGALFSRWWRRWRFWPAAALSTLLALGRYLFDPILPHTLEVWAGAVFYIGLLGLSACALRAWSGSLLPGYLATVVFFAAYRTLHQ